MPIGMISKFERCLAEACFSRGYQSSGVAILRPSWSVTTSSLAVNSTERGRRSPTSISKVLIPGRLQCVTVRSKIANNITKLMRGISRVDGDGQVMKPELGFFIAGADVDMAGFFTFV